MSEPQEQQQQEQSLSATQESSDQPPATTAPAPPATQTSPPHRMPQLSAQTIQVTVKTLDDREATVTIALDVRFLGKMEKGGASRGMKLLLFWKKVGGAKRNNVFEKKKRAEPDSEISNNVSEWKSGRSLDLKF